MGTEPGERRVGRARCPAPMADSDRVPEAQRAAWQDPARSPSSHATDLQAMHVEVERRMVRGDRFSDVEDAINASALSADEQSALWLLAWSYVDWRAQRREARAHLAAFAADEPGPTVGRSRMLRLVV
jgi:hypothetical protein